MSCLARWGSTVAAASVPGPGPPARPGSRWWLADRPPPAGSHDRPASRRERACAPCRWAGPCRGPSARSGSGPWPSARSYRRPVPMKTSMSSVFIFVPPLVAWVRGQPVDDRSRTHACERPHTQRVVPLIGSHQRPAAAGDFRPPPDHLRTGARQPCPQQLARPRTTQDHQQGNGALRAVQETTGDLETVRLPRPNACWQHRRHRERRHRRAQGGHLSVPGRPLPPGGGPPWSPRERPARQPSTSSTKAQPPKVCPNGYVADNGMALGPSRRGYTGRLVEHVHSLGGEPITSKQSPTTPPPRARTSTSASPCSATWSGSPWPPPSPSFRGNPDPRLHATARTARKPPNRPR